MRNKKEEEVVGDGVSPSTPKTKLLRSQGNGGISPCNQTQNENQSGDLDESGANPKKRSKQQGSDVSEKEAESHKKKKKEAKDQSSTPSNELRCVIASGTGWRCPDAVFANNYCKKHFKYYNKKVFRSERLRKKQSGDQVQSKNVNTLATRSDQRELRYVRKTAGMIDGATDSDRTMNTDSQKPSESKKEKATKSSLSLIADPKMKRALSACMTETGKFTNFDTPNTEVGETSPAEGTCQNLIDAFSFPSEGLGADPPLNIGPENILGVSDGNESGKLQKFGDSSLSPPLKGAQDNSSKIQAQFLGKSHDVQSSSHSTKILGGDGINQQKRSVGEQTTTILETAMQSKDPEHETPCREVAEVVQTERGSKGTEIMMTETLSNAEDLTPMPLEESYSPTRMDKRKLLDKQLPSLCENAITLIESSLKDSEKLNPSYGKDSISLEENGNIGDQFSKALKQRNESGVQSCRENTNVASEDGTLPFTKHNPVWGHLQAMEIYRLMPQSPHFRPLQECNALLREGLAIGYMISFADLAERTRKARLDEPKSSFENKLKALVELEAIGFSVEPIRSRLEEMLSVKTSLAELDGELKQVEGKVMEVEQEKESLNSQVDEIDQKLRELEESLIKTKQQRQLIVEEKQVKDTYVVTLQKRFQHIEEEIQGINLSFSTAPPW